MRNRKKNVNVITTTLMSMTMAAGYAAMKSEKVLSKDVFQNTFVEERITKIKDKQKEKEEKCFYRTITITMLASILVIFLITTVTITRMGINGVTDLELYDNWMIKGLKGMMIIPLVVAVAGSVIFGVWKVKRDNKEIRK